MSYAPLFRKEENRKIVLYLRKYGEASANDIPLEGISLRKKSMLLKKMFDNDLLSRYQVRRNKWIYRFTSAWINKKFWWEE